MGSQTQTGVSWKGLSLENLKKLVKIEIKKSEIERTNLWNYWENQRLNAFDEGGSVNYRENQRLSLGNLVAAQTINIWGKCLKNWINVLSLLEFFKNGIREI